MTATFNDITPPPVPQITDTDPDSPANDNNPEVKGTATGGATTVKLYTNASCTGSPAATGSTTSFAAGGITLPVPGDATTQIAARAADAAGNDSSCSAAFPYTEDSTAPATPSLTDTDPDSPANDNNPEVKGSAGGGATVVRLFANATCSGSPATTGTPAGFAGAGITLGVGGDATTQITAKSADAAGNESSCSSPLAYTEDSTAPAAPSLTDTDPDSPANDNNPEVKGSAGGGATAVSLFTSSNCSGLPAATGTPGQLASPGLTVAVPGDATTQFSARSSDAAGNASSCSAPLAYTEDSAGPPAPTLTDTDPDSPANDNNPEVKGTATGDAVRVDLFANAGCTGSAAATGSAASFAAPGITLTVSSDATTQISARSADTVGNLSACSASLSYTEDSSAPPAPVLIGTEPGSPANENDPRVQGSAGGDADSVELYASTDCSGVLAATGTPAQLAGGGLSVEVTDDTTTSFSARSFDGINASQCSNSISYREDSTGPDTLFSEPCPTRSSSSRVSGAVRPSAPPVAPSRSRSRPTRSCPGTAASSTAGSGRPATPLTSSPS